MRRDIVQVHRVPLKERLIPILVAQNSYDMSIVKTKGAVGNAARTEAEFLNDKYSDNIHHPWLP